MDYLAVLVDREVWALRKVFFCSVMRRDERRRDDLVMTPQTQIKMMLKMMLKRRRLTD